MLILAIIVIGMFAGWLANLILGGATRPTNYGELMIVGFAGSFVGGTLGSLTYGDGFNIRASGLVGSVIGAIIVLVIWRAVRPKKPTATAGPKGRPQPRSKKQR